VQTAQATTPGFGLPSPAFLPRRYKPRNVGEWTGHLTFASDLILSLQPQLIVELGTHWGEAYFTFCQTVQEHGLSSLCYAVDHWLGDEHAGHYGEEVFDEVRDYNDRYYRQFSYLLRKSFDDALSQFSDDSIGLLHIDGLHTYEAVAHDFRAWLPKVQPGGIILLHDICPRHQDFGVWRLWEEVRAEFHDTFEFHHSWGLGVVRRPGSRSETSLTEFLFAGSPEVREEVRRHYVIYASHLEHLLGRIPPLAAPRLELTSEVRVQVFPSIDGIHSPETSQIRSMTAGKWNTLVFDLRDPKVQGPFRIDPGSEPSLIEVGDILIHSGETGELLWSSLASSEKHDLQVAGTALSYSNESPLIINVGDDPQFLLATPPNVQGPLKLSVSLKIVAVPRPAMEIFNCCLQRMQAEQRATEADLTRALAATNQTEAELQNARQLLDQSESTIVGIQNSLSWRVTAPLRAFMTALRSGPRKAR